METKLAVHSVCVGMKGTWGGTNDRMQLFWSYGAPTGGFLLVLMRKANPINNIDAVDLHSITLRRYCDR